MVVVVPQTQRVVVVIAGPQRQRVDVAGPQRQRVVDVEPGRWEVAERVESCGGPSVVGSVLPHGWIVVAGSGQLEKRLGVAERVGSYRP